MTGAIYYGRDTYALRALGMRDEDEDVGFGDLFVAARGVTESVIPDVDESCLTLEGTDPEAQRFLNDTLLSSSSSRDLWHQPTLPMELHSWLNQLIYHGRLFVHFSFLESPSTGLWHLADTTWLAPETITYRPGEKVYEQFASNHRFEDPGYYAVEGEPESFISRFPESEVLDLRWPLSSPGPVPAQSVRALGRRQTQEAQRSLLAMRSQTDQDAFITLARGRAGAYAKAVERQKAASARIKDMLFYPGATEAEIFPWIDEVSEYFTADRIVRSRIAISQLRDYLFGQINRQLLEPWCERNGWPATHLALRTDHFTEKEWKTMRCQLDDGVMTLDDIKTAVQLEWDCGHAFGRFG